MSSLEKLKKINPELVEEYSKMDGSELLEQICSEVLDLFAMDDRVKTFMSECTINMSNTNYTIESIKALIVEKQEKDIRDFCSDMLDLPISEIPKELKRIYNS